MTIVRLLQFILRKIGLKGATKATAKGISFLYARSGRLKYAVEAFLKWRAQGLLHAPKAMVRAMKDPKIGADVMRHASKAMNNVARGAGTNYRGYNTALKAIEKATGIPNAKQLLLNKTFCRLLTWGTPKGKGVVMSVLHGGALPWFSAELAAEAYVLSEGSDGAMFIAELAGEILFAEEADERAKRLFGADSQEGQDFRKKAIDLLSAIVSDGQMQQVLLSTFDGEVRSGKIADPIDRIRNSALGAQYEQITANLSNAVHEFEKLTGSDVTIEGMQVDSDSVTGAKGVVNQYRLLNKQEALTFDNVKAQKVDFPVLVHDGVAAPHSSVAMEGAKYGIKDGAAWMVKPPDSLTGSFAPKARGSALSTYDKDNDLKLSNTELRSVAADLAIVRAPSLATSGPESYQNYLRAMRRLDNLTSDEFKAAWEMSEQGGL